MSQLTIKTFVYPEAFSAMQAIRRSVFQEEQGVDPILEFDGKDEISTHLLAYLGDRPVGTARVRTLDKETAKIERLAVLSTARRLGIGKKLLEKALEVAAQNNVGEVVIHAQDYAKGLYQQFGFEQVGERFDEAGISHIKMIKRLK
jgi:predicted GNAT family N-acyltransferase